MTGDGIILNEAHRRIIREIGRRVSRVELLTKLNVKENKRIKAAIVRWVKKHRSQKHHEENERLADVVGMTICDGRMHGGKIER